MRVCVLLVRVSHCSCRIGTCVCLIGWHMCVYVWLDWYDTGWHVCGTGVGLLSTLLEVHTNQSASLLRSELS